MCKSLFGKWISALLMAAEAILPNLIPGMRRGTRLEFFWSENVGVVSSAGMAGFDQMEIRIESLLEGAKRAQGTVVIVDVFRAFTTAAAVLSRGVAKIVLVVEIDEALAMRDEGAGDERTLALLYRVTFEHRMGARA